MTILKNSQYVIGNSSTGIREAPVYGVPSVNIGTRQFGRFKSESIVDCDTDKKSILDAISKVKSFAIQNPSYNFGDGKSFERFMEIIKKDTFWDCPKQKFFVDANV